MSAGNGYKVIGTRPVRHDGVDKVTGRAVYGGDTRLSGLLYGQVLRSPHAHAKIKSIDTTAALKAPGILGVFIGADLAADGVGGLPCGWTITQTNGELWNAPTHEVIATEKARYVGDQVTLELSPCAASYALTAALHEVLGEHGAAEVESTSLPVAVG